MSSGGVVPSTQMLRSRSPVLRTADTTSSRVSARITPRLAARSTGFTTQGNPTAPMASSMTLSDTSTSVATKCGCRTPAAVSRPRMTRLSRVASTDATWLRRNVPSRCATCAAVTTDDSSTPITASTGHFAANAAARSADSSGRRRSSVSTWPSISEASVGASFDATTMSNPSFSAARRNAVAR
jgi:hypothetical protein